MVTFIVNTIVSPTLGCPAFTVTAFQVVGNSHSTLRQPMGCPSLSDRVLFLFRLSTHREPVCLAQLKVLRWPDKDPSLRTTILGDWVVHTICYASDDAACLTLGCLLSHVWITRDNVPHHHRRHHHHCHQESTIPCAAFNAAAALSENSPIRVCKKRNE
jgi:hypothetical protein